MFIIVQFPLADIRPQFSGGFGRLSKPDWRADFPQGFIRGFGKISSRTQSGLSLRGERVFADCTQAIKFIEVIQLRQDNIIPLQITPWFRRLYYDGEFAGRFEFGFIIPDGNEELAFYASNEATIRPSEVGKAILSTKVQINSTDGSAINTRLADCISHLGIAYTAATTNSAELGKFPPAELYGSYVKVGSPIIHLRVSSNRYVEVGRDKRVIDAEADIMFASADGFAHRNGIIVQASKENTFDEQVSERVTRVLFSHLNSLLFACAHVAAATHEGKITGKKQEMRDLVKEIVGRLARFSSPQTEEDKHLLASFKLFSEAYDGRIDELSEKLTAIAGTLARPTMGEGVLNYAKALHELVIKYTVDSVVKASMK